MFKRLIKFLKLIISSSNTLGLCALCKSNYVDIVMGYYYCDSCINRSAAESEKLEKENK